MRRILVLMLSGAAAVAALVLSGNPQPQSAPAGAEPVTVLLTFGGKADCKSAGRIAILPHWSFWVPCGS